MTLEKAIKIKEQCKCEPPNVTYPELIEADDLSIEALKVVALCRQGFDASVHLPLPGETGK